MSQRRVSLALAIVASLVAAITLAPATSSAEEEKKTLEQQLQEQQARNDALRQRIAELEKILATDVCNNPEAAALVERGGSAPAKKE